MLLVRIRSICFCFLIGSYSCGGVLAEEHEIPATTPEKTVCQLIDEAAARHALPVDFFTRLIWKESRFRSDAVSPKGAQGIAQFMPETAALRKLADPFDPAHAIPASAHYLSDLAGMFGNLGLAAAAYNAGEQRVSDWLAGSRRLPVETKDYVVFITGRSAEDWKGPSPSLIPEKSLHIAEMSEEDCAGVTARLSVASRGLATAAPQRGNKQPVKGPSVTVWRNGKSTTYSVLRGR